MKTAAVIAELNPPHNGHADLFRRIREEHAADRLIVLMSGDFVQRGEPAVMDKHRRARAALGMGADLVLALPVVYSLAPAEVFARGAVLTLDAARVADTLVFGSECGALAPLQTLAALSDADPSALRAALLAAMSEGAPYPQALARAFAGAHPGQKALAALLDGPNNVLGVEYLRSLARTGSRMEPVTIARTPASGHITGAKALREMIAAEDPRSAARSFFAEQEAPAAPSPLAARLAPYLPPASLAECRAVLVDADARFVLADDLSQMLQYRLVTGDAASWAETGDIGADLARRMEKYRYACAGLDAFAHRLKVRAFTLSRIRRGLMQLLLDLRRAERDAMLAEGCTVLRVLGFSASARTLLGEIGDRKRGDVPLIVRGADFTADAPPLTRRLLALEQTAGALYEQLALAPEARRTEPEKPPVIKN